MNSLKIGYFLSVVATLASFFTMGYGFYNTETLTVIMSLPIFTVFYPIALIGTLSYMIKRVLKSKSIFELLQMTGGGSAMGDMMSGLGETQEEEDSDE